MGFSLLTPSVPWALRIARRIKREIGAITIAGNVHVIVNPEIIEEEGLDIACMAEGEPLVEELAACIDEGRPYAHIRGLF